MCIRDRPEAVANTVRGRVVDGHIEIPELSALGDETLQNVDRIIIIACGTASYAGQIGAYAIEQWARICLLYTSRCV